MLKVSRRQLAALDRHCEDRFEERLVDEIMREFCTGAAGAAAVPRQSMLEFVRASRMRSAEMGLFADADVAALTTYLAAYTRLAPAENEVFRTSVAVLFSRPDASGPATMALADHRLRVMEPRHPFAARIRLQVARICEAFG